MNGQPSGVASVPSDATAATDAPEHRRRTFQAMGCSMAMTLAGPDRGAAETAFDAGQAEVERIEARLSRFRPTSELVRLNARSGRWVVVSPLLAAVLHTALRAAQRSGGWCTPTLLPALEAAGYDRDFDTLSSYAAHPAPPHAPALESRRCLWHRRALARGRVRRRPAPGPDWRAVRLATTPQRRVRVHVPHGTRLDVAGVAKGWTADRVAGLLAPYGPCLVDAGGDLAARGAPDHLDGWPVAVADPREPDADIALVLLRDAGIATSGIDFRCWAHNGRPRHHLIDPRTGEPSRTDVLTATVIASTATAAEAHAKAALLLGMRRGLAYLADKSLAGLIVGRKGRIVQSSLWSRYAIPT